VSEWRRVDYTAQLPECHKVRSFVESGVKPMCTRGACKRQHRPRVDAEGWKSLCIFCSCGRVFGTSRRQLTDNLHQFSGYAEGVRWPLIFCNARVGLWPNLTVARSARAPKPARGTPTAGGRVLDRRQAMAPYRPGMRQPLHAPQSRSRPYADAWLKGRTRLQTTTNLQGARSPNAI
jgi:hypothetical protein